MFDLAIYYRMAGGFIGLGSTQLSRLRWAAVMACYMALLSLVHHEDILHALALLPACALMTFLGRLISHAAFQGGASLGHSIGMAVVNVLRLLLIVLPYSFGSLFTLSDFHISRIFLALFGVMAGVAYWLGNKYLNTSDSGIYYRNNSCQSTIADLDHAAITGPEWGELLTGWLAYELFFIVALVVP